jgi:hypothetical protein
MTWFNAHWWQLLVGWGVLNSCVLAPLSSQVPTTTWYGKLLHAFVGLSPMDVLKVVKAYGAQAIPPTMALAVFLLAGTSSCSLFSSSAPSAPSKSVAAVQSVMQSTLDLAAHAWNESAAVCLAEAGDSGTAGNRCYLALQPVHDQIVAAGVAVQIFSDADQANLPCLLQDIANGLASAATFMKNPPQSLHDAAVVANQFSTSCKRDGGAS